MNFLLHFIRNYPFSCILFAAIWYLSLLFNAPETPLNDIKLIDKWVHMVMYGGTCTVLWIEYIRHHKSPDYENLGFWAIAAPIIMSGIIELLQAYCTTNRNGDWYDLLANSIGVLMAALIGMILFKTKKAK